MDCDFIGKYLIWIILAIIAIIWFTYWWTNREHAMSPQMPLEPSPTTVRQADIINEPNSEMTPFTLYYFHDPKCGGCRKFTPIWNEISARLKSVPGISLRMIDNSKLENETLSFYYNIIRTPTIILVTPDKSIEYNGTRTADNIHQFIITNVQQYTKK